jgi:hypothetical protein
MHQYEYSVMAFETSENLNAREKTSHDLNKEGESGWELVTVVPLGMGDKSLFYFKRQVPTDPT